MTQQRKRNDNFISKHFAFISVKGHAKIYLLNFKTIKREIRKISDDIKKHTNYYKASHV